MNCKIEIGLLTYRVKMRLIVLLIWVSKHFMLQFDKETVSKWSGST